MRKVQCAMKHWILAGVECHSYQALARTSRSSARERERLRFVRFVCRWPLAKFEAFSSPEPSCPLNHRRLGTRIKWLWGPRITEALDSRTSGIHVWSLELSLNLVRITRRLSEANVLRLLILESISLRELQLGNAIRIIVEKRREVSDVFAFGKSLIFQLLPFELTHGWRLVTSSPASSFWSHRRWMHWCGIRYQTWQRVLKG